MLDFLWSLVGFSLKVLGIVLAINLVILIVKGGRETMRDLRDTVCMAIKVGLTKTQAWLRSKY